MITKNELETQVHRLNTECARLSRVLGVALLKGESTTAHRKQLAKAQQERQDAEAMFGAFDDWKAQAINAAFLERSMTNRREKVPAEEVMADRMRFQAEYSGLRGTHALMERARDLWWMAKKSGGVAMNDVRQCLRSYGHSSPELLTLVGED